MADARSFNELLNNIFGATDKIISERIKNLAYDKTITATIVDASNRAKGEYTCSDGSTTFFAYSENTNYTENLTVYVNIPNGDFTKIKTITAKYVNNDSEYYTYKPPMDTYVDITGNLLGLYPGETNNYSSEQGLVANGDRKEITLWYAENLKNAGYERMGLKCSFRSWLSSLKAISGNYGVRLDLIAIEKNSTQTAESYKYYTYYLDTKNMIGDPYNFATYYDQQIVFDVSNITEIYTAQLVFYQNTNFKTVADQPVPHTDDFGDELANNIFVKEPYISFGYSLEDFSGDKVLIYSLNESTYAGHLTDETKISAFGEEASPTEAEITEYLNKINTKTVDLRWIHVYDTNTIKAVKELDLDPQNTIIHWYRYKLDSSINDELAGPFWEEVQNSEDQIAAMDEAVDQAALFQYTFVPDYTESQELIKVIIESPSAKYIQEVTMVDDNDFWNLKTKVTELSAWITENKDTITELYEKKVTHPEAFTEADEKAIKEYETKENEYNELFEDYSKSLGEYSETNYYYSDLLTFVNEDLVPDKATIDQITGLTIECDTNNGTNGIFRLYDDTGKILTTADANRKRLLTAKYSSLITGNEELDTAESITWYIPIINSMIEPPTEGVDYNIGNAVVGVDGKTTTVYSSEAIVLGPEDSRYRAGYICLYRENINPIQAYEVETDDEGNTVTDAKGNPVYKYDEAGNKIKKIGAEQPAESEQIFRIKSYYSQQASNNTVYCVIRKNSRDYEASCTMSFGTFSTNGTDYTLTLEFADGKPALLAAKGETLTVVPHIYDYENNDVTESSGATFTYSWFTDSNSLDPSGDVVTKSQASGSRNCTVTYSQTANNYWACYILKCTASGVVKRGETSINLTECIPIPIRFEGNTTYIGAEKIAYNEQGVSPSYYQGACELKSFIDGVTQDYTSPYYLRVVTGEDSAAVISWSKFYPSFKYTQGTESSEFSSLLTVPSMYIDSIKPCAIVAFKYNQGQNIDNSIINNGSISFNNIAWIQPLYIYQFVYNSGMLNSWDGHLNIDKDNDTIMAAMIGAGYKDNENRFNGVLMGKLNKAFDWTSNATGLFGFHQGSESFGFNIDGTAFIGKSDKGRILFDGSNSTITSVNYNKGYEGLKIDLDSSPYISVRVPYGTKNSNGVYSSYPTVFKIGDTESYLQTADYSSGDKTGARITLSSNGSSSFDIKAYSSEGGVQISSSSPYLKAMVKGSNGSYFPVLVIGNSESYLQTNNYQSGKSGAKIDLKSSIFTLAGYSGTKSVVITNDTSKNPIHVKNTNGNIQTYISWDGSFFTGSSKQYLSYSGGKLLLKNGSISTGYFYADTDQVDLGNYHVNDDGGPEAFYYGEWDDSPVGMDGEANRRQWYLWAGPNGDANNGYNFWVNKGGISLHNIVVKGSAITDKITINNINSNQYSQDVGTALSEIYASIKTDWSWLVKVESHPDIHKSVHHPWDIAISK